MARRSGLGKGLSSLIPPGEAEPGDTEQHAVLRDIPVGDITPNPNQPRVHFDEETLAELTASIQQIGVLQPILVRPTEDGFELIAGERRWRAAGRAGLAMIPAVVRDTDDEASIEQALVENLHRQDLTPLEEAAAYPAAARRLRAHPRAVGRSGRQEPLGDHEHAAAARASAGRSSTSSPTASCRPDMHGPCWRHRTERCRSRWPGRLSTRVGACAPSKRRSRLGGGAVVADDPAEKRPRLRVRTEPAWRPTTRLRPPGLLELEELLAEHLETRVSVQMGAKRGGSPSSSPTWRTSSGSIAGWRTE